PEAVLGAFSDEARDVWGWAVASVPDGFHPRHALERWYRYYLFEDIPVDFLRKAAAVFVGVHDFQSFTKEEPLGELALDEIDVTSSEGGILIDVRARSFLGAICRGMVDALASAALY